jgi:nitrogen regulatory protein PII
LQLEFGSEKPPAAVAIRSEPSEGISMKLVKCIIRPNRLEEVREALSKVNVSGMTVSEVRGHGRQKGHKAIYRGREYSVTLLPKMMIEMVLPDDLVDEVLKVITER